MTDFPRLIEHAFPLKQASLDSVHEKMCHAGHIKAIHIWPARRPLAACRAALIATLLPDPSAQPKPAGMSDSQWQEEIRRRRQELCEKIGGTVVKKIEKKKMPNGQTVDRVKEETEGGILHWKRETENAETVEWFRQEIRKTYGGRAPKVLDPFAGGGAIPLEAMRLGCEATAIDINPVAWFILKCTLEYPQRLAGQTWPLPDFILRDRDFMETFYKKAKGYTAAQTRKALERLGHRLEEGQGALDLGADTDNELQADLAWHVRAWGQWVLQRARRDLAKYYPVYADFEPLKPGRKSYERQPMRLVPLKDDGTPDLGALNADFSEEYLAQKSNPRWVAKPTVAYLWARTVACKNCRTIVPLLKSCWVRKRGKVRVLLTLSADPRRGQVEFGIEDDVPVKGGNAAQRREHDKRLGAGTMTRAGARCPSCGTIATMEDIRLEAQAGRLGVVPTVVAVSGQKTKEYRLPTDEERQAVSDAAKAANRTFDDIPFGKPEEPTPTGGGRGAGRAFSIQGYGLRTWADLFTSRQLVVIGHLVHHVRAAGDEMRERGLPARHAEAVLAYLACVIDKVADYNSALVAWQPGGGKGANTFQRWALPIKWDFTENNILEGDSGGWRAVLNWVTEPVTGSLALVARDAVAPHAVLQSAIGDLDTVDVIVTDPPYYDAIPYADCMDFFYVWLRRALHGSCAEFDAAFAEPLSPKWDDEKRDGELIDDETRHGGDVSRSKAAYEDGMFRAFQACHRALTEGGSLVIVFANKEPDAWETLVSAVIRAGFVVNGSWPIQTEMGNRTRALTGAALASSVWLVCKKRTATARPGWDNAVLDEMRVNIAGRLREFWDAGIRGPDFVWAATGPALEAYSKHPVVKKADEPGSVMVVSEFLTHVRRMVVDFVVGRVLSGDGEADAAADRLDEPTAYYLLHRHDFGMDEVPAGTCILYAISCGLSDSDLADTWDILARVGGESGVSSVEPDEGEDEAEDADSAEEIDEGSGSKVKLKTWAQRRRRTMGYEAPGGKPVPLIDRLHCLMHLWKEGDVQKVDEYLDDNGLRRHELFRRVLQALVELAPAGSDERSLLESLSNHIGAKGDIRKNGQLLLEDQN